MPASKYKIERKCEVCGKTFLAKTVYSKYCSHNCTCAAYRNKKRTIFINPGSVGQPRNHNPYAQYGILDIESGNYEHRCVWYDVKEEQKLFIDSVDKFYKDRLTLGI
jgi:diadenosine tetraphosphatase ApaH/serine/threonine PP2A family protein phosphatase